MIEMVEETVAFSSPPKKFKTSLHYVDYSPNFGFPPCPCPPPQRKTNNNNNTERKSGPHLGLHNNYN